MNRQPMRTLRGPARLAALAAAVVLVAGAAAAGDGSPTGFTPLVERIEEPYTNDKCLEKCHGLPGFAASAANGVLRELHVDLTGFVLSTHGQKGVECVDCHQGADPNAHPRVGYPDVDCRACHAKEPPAGVFPADALARLKQKGIEPPKEESRKADTWLGTKHGKAWLEGDPAAPFCAHCHSAHAVKPSADPASTVNRANLARTCGACHVDQVRSYDVGGVLARFRIGAHGKGDLSSRYAVTECLSCHQGQGAHGEERLTEQRCPTCHRVPEQAEPAETGQAVTYAGLHIKPLAADQPVARALRWLYRLGFWGAAAGAGLLLVVLGFSTLYRKQDSSSADR